MRNAPLLTIAWIGLACAGVAAPPKPPDKSLKTSAQPSGPNLYRDYCASCHGEDAKGAGTVADSLRMRPSDLTTLKSRNGGTFPSFRLRSMLDGSDELPVHGSRRMPVWGPGLGPDRTRALILYLEKLQK